MSQNIDRQNDKLIEEYRHSKEGYNPYLIGPKWQVAQLNYEPDLAPNTHLGDYEFFYLKEKHQKELYELIESVWKN
jgi:hypothetical protein